MPRSKIIVICKLCEIPFRRWSGQVNAKYCSKKCSCKSKHTKAFQSRAGKAGGYHKTLLRGTGTKTYIKEFGRHQHRVVMERYLKRKLRSGEIIHHIDGNKHNNCITNLELTTQPKHILKHLPEMLKSRKRKHGY